MIIIRDEWEFHDVMERMGYRLAMGVSAAFFVVCMIESSAGPAEKGGTDASRIDMLKSRLEQVRGDLAATQDEAARKSREFYKLQHDIVYSNKMAAIIYREIKTLEKSLVEKRRKLNEEIMKLPELRELMKKRKAFLNAPEG